MAYNACAYRRWRNDYIAALLQNRAYGGRLGYAQLAAGAASSATPRLSLWRAPAARRRRWAERLSRHHLSLLLATNGITTRGGTNPCVSLFSTASMIPGYSTCRNITPLYCLLQNYRTSAVLCAFCYRLVGVGVFSTHTPHTSSPALQSATLPVPSSAACATTAYLLLPLHGAPFGAFGGWRSAG